MSNRTSPRDIVAQWLPHGFILSIMGMSILLVIWVMESLLPILLMAAALSAFLYPLTAGPIHKIIERKIFKFSSHVKRRISGILAISLILLLVLSPIFITIYSMIGSTGISKELVIGIVTKNINDLDHLFAQLTEQIEALQKQWPALPIDPEWVNNYIRNTFMDVLSLQPALLGFFFKGTGNFVVQSLLCILVMIFYFSEGGTLIRSILAHTPLSQEESEKLLSTFQNVILRLLVDTLGTAILKGTLLGLLVSAFIDLNPMLLIFFASFICLLPLIGTTLIWLPAASTLYKQDQLFEALLLAVLCQIVIFGANMLQKHLDKKLHEHSAATSFFIFLSVIGGLVTFGFKGLVLGPMAIVLVMVLGRFWRDYYNESLKTQT